MGTGIRLYICNQVQLGFIVPLLWEPLPNTALHALPMLFQCPELHPFFFMWGILLVLKMNAFPSLKGYLLLDAIFLAFLDSKMDPNTFKTEEWKNEGVLSCLILVSSLTDHIIEL